MNIAIGFALQTKLSLLKNAKEIYSDWLIF